MQANNILASFGFGPHAIVGLIAHSSRWTTSQHDLHRFATLAHHLTESKRAKLRLAGRGDIKRFFDQVEDRRQQFETDRQSFRTGLADLQRLEPLTQVYRDGPFGDGSLSAKTLSRFHNDQEAA
jgi:hypothetical protein